ncbi:MAG: transglycosylase domain-containing protein, partial [Actinomycetes bacterium]
MSDQLPTPWPRRLLRLVGIITATSLLVAAVTLAGLLPAAHRAMAAAEAVGGVAAPAGRLLARPETRSVVQAADGSVLAVLHGDQDRVVVPLSTVPVRVRDAVLAAEDARYYQHGALDLRGIARAIAVDLTSGHLREGGSTIAQQYVKNVVTGDRRSLHRKLVEAVDAAALERTASKDRILAAYLNQVYFGDGVYGIATAAQHYFSRPVGKLSLAQAAALAGTIASPERFRPTAGREALARRNLVLNRMAAVGFASPARVAAAKRQPLAPRPHLQSARFASFVEDVTRTLLGDHALDADLGPA